MRRAAWVTFLLVDLLVAPATLWYRSPRGLASAVTNWFRTMAFDPTLLPDGVLEGHSTRVQAPVFSADVVLWNRGPALGAPREPLRIVVPNGHVLKATILQATTPSARFAVATLADGARLWWQRLRSGDGVVVRVAYVAPAVAEPAVSGTTRVDFQPQEEWKLWSLGICVLFLPLILGAAFSAGSQWGKSFNVTILVILAALTSILIVLSFHIIAWRAPTILTKAVAP